MSIRKKAALILLVVGSMVISDSKLLYAESFEGREDEMNAKCAVIKDTKTQELCRQYKEYLQSKSSDLDSEIADIKSQIAKVKGNMDEIIPLIQENDEKIAQYDKQINSVQANIDKMQSSIDSMNEEIVKKEDNIKERNKSVQEHLVKMQAYSGSNYYIDFLMGSLNFSDLLRRTEIVGELNQYQNDQITLLNKEKKQLKEDRVIVDEQKELLVEQQNSIKGDKAKVQVLNDAKNELLAGYKQQEATLSNQKRVAQMAQVSLPKIDLSIAADFDEPQTPQTPSDNGGETNGGTGETPGETPETPQTPDAPSTPSGGGSVGGNDYFLSPLAYGWHYEAGTWSYPDGGGHMGMDFSTGLQLNIPVQAPASGIILHTNSGCANGYSDCGIPIGGGNNVLLLTKKGDTIYAMPFYHMTSVAVSVGQKVTQGQTLGYSGDSGWSWGNHCHVEVIRVGVMSMSDAVDIFNRTGDLTFGTGWNAEAPTACGSAPCRERPENYWL